MAQPPFNPYRHSLDLNTDINVTGFTKYIFFLRLIHKDHKFLMKPRDKVISQHYDAD